MEQQQVTSLENDGIIPVALTALSHWQALGAIVRDVMDFFLDWLEERGEPLIIQYDDSRFVVVDPDGSHSREL